MAVVFDIDAYVASMRIRLENRDGIAGMNAEDSVCMHRVPGSLSEISPKAIQPEMVSIGPYHYGNTELMNFKRYKWWYLDRFLSRLERPVERDLKGLFEAVNQLEERARRCYHQPPASAMPRAEFVEMMVLDGCFIIELFRLGGSIDDFLKPDWIPIITRDLLKLENQLPFFVLETLFCFSSGPDNEQDPLKLLALKFFDISLPTPHEEVLTDVKHLLHLFHLSFCTDLERQESVPTAFQIFREQARRGPANLIRYLASKPLLAFGLSYMMAGSAFALGIRMAWVLQRRVQRSLFPWISDPEYHPSSESIQCAAKLRSAGIKFNSLRANNFLVIVFNIYFSILQIPPIPIDDLAISVFINCIAFEQGNYNHAHSCFTTYIAFISCLVNSSQDVAILSAHGIITSSFLHNDHDIAALFKKLGEKVYFHKNDCYLSQQFREMENYYNSPLADLQRTYFSRPWSLISFLSAFVLLVLSVCQTVLSFLTYGHSPKTGSAS